MQHAMTGKQHERAVEAAGRALRLSPLGAYSDYGRRAIDAYFDSLAEQGVVLVDLGEVVGWLVRWRDGSTIAVELERRFGNEGGG